MKIQTEKTVKSYKGITLVALVVTIIILLILAGVTLYAVFNENGLLQKTKQTAIIKRKRLFD